MFGGNQGKGVFISHSLRNTVPGWSVESTLTVSCEVRTELCILPTQCICVFRMVLTTNSDCFPKQH
jgi:hypothetical protein